MGGEHEQRASSATDTVRATEREQAVQVGGAREDEERAPLIASGGGRASRDSPLDRSPRFREARRRGHDRAPTLRLSLAITVDHSDIKENIDYVYNSHRL